MTKNSKMGGRTLRGPAAKLHRFLRRGAADQSGAAAVFFAVCLLLLAPLTLGLVDVYMATTQRGELLDALDTATLYVARSKETDADKLNAMGLKVLTANLNLPAGQTVASSSFVLVDGRKIVSEAQITPPSFSPKFWTQNNLKANSEVTRNSVNLEVAVVLDVTGSMSNDMGNLRTAAAELVDILVNDDQDPYYSRMALIPYSAAVNVGGMATDVRGSIAGPMAISGATKGNPVVITATAHGFENDEWVYITGVVGMTQINNKAFQVANKTTNTFQLKDVNGGSYSTYSSGGSAYCTKQGCEYYRFRNADENRVVHKVTTCASERTGSEAYTDVSPATAKVGRTYVSMSSPNTCPSSTVVPLTSNKTDLKATITGLTHAGSTAGHIGLAWGWYAVSPNFNSIWGGPTAASYGEDELIKAVVLMTDGAFNTAYCKGVIAQNSGSGSGGDDIHINCDATNDQAFAQARTLCTNIKAKGITLYTVGFNIGSDATAKSFVHDCASEGRDHLANGGTALKDVFKEIGQDINRLRISK